MSRCVNKNLPAFKELVQQSGLPSFVVAAKAGVWMTDNDTDQMPSAEDLGIVFGPIASYAQRETDAESEAMVEAFAQDLSKRFNIDYEIVSEAQARQLFPNYQGEPAFYVNKKAYLVKGKASRESAIHEIFGHPFLDIIEKENPTLFLNLADQALQNEGIRQYVQTHYPSAVQNGQFTSEGVKEAIIRAIELDARGKLDDKKMVAAIKRFWNAIVKRMKAMFNISDFRPTMTIGELTDFILSDTQLDLSSAESLAKVRLKAASLQDRIYSKVLQLNDKMVQMIKDGVETYINQDKPENKYQRVTEFTKNFDYAPMTSDEMAIRKAESDFVKAGIAQTDKIKIDTNEYTFDEYVSYLKIRFEDGRTYGKMGHLYMELILGGNQNSINAQIRELEKAIPGVRNGMNNHEEKFDFILKESENIRDFLDIEPEDKIITEQIVYSDTLKVATRLDLLQIKANGQAVIGDFKLGNLTSDEHTSKFFKYATPDAQTHMAQSKLNEARLQVVLRAMMLKEQQPDIRFEDLWVATIDPLALVRNKETIHLQDFLSMLENYYKQEDPEVYKKFSEKGLFDSSNYWGKSSTLLKAASDKKYKENPGGYTTVLYDKLLDIQNKLRRLEKDNFLTPSELKKARVELEGKREQLMKQIIEMNSESDAQELFTATEDISVPRAWMGSQYDARNELAQAYFKILNERKAIARQNIEANKAKYATVAEKVLNEYLTKMGIPKSVTGKTGVNNLLGMGFKYFKGDGTGIYDFAYKLKSGEYGTGHYLVTEKDEEWNKMTHAQKEYISFIRDSMNAQYEKATGRVVYNLRGQPMTKAELLNRSKSLKADFFPRIPMQANEYTERYGMKGAFKKYKEAMFGDYVDEYYTTAKEAVGIPLKGMGNSLSIQNIVQDSDHSFDLETSYMNFMNNLYMMEQLDDVQALGEGVQGWIKEQQNMDGSPKMKNLATFMNHQMMLHLTDTKPKVKWMNYKWIDKETGKAYTVGLDTLFKTLKAFTTFGSMWLQLPNAVNNGGLITILNHKRAGLGSIAKMKGIRDEDIDFTQKNLWWAKKEFMQMKADIIAGKKDENKLYRLLSHFNYMPESYDYALRSEEKVIGKNKSVNGSTLVFMNSFVEDFGTITVFGSLMNHMKVKTKDGRDISVYDAYELVDSKDKFGNPYKEIRWRADVAPRGVEVFKGPEGDVTKSITELTSREIMHLKRASQKIHGAYRQDERSAADLYAAGQLLMQFKKYLPTQIANHFSTAYKDHTQGRYQELFDKETGKPVLIDVTDPLTGEVRQEKAMEWAARLHEGRVITTMKYLLAWMGALGKENMMYKLFAKAGIKLEGNNKDYRWDNLTPEQKQNILLHGLDWVTCGIIYLAYLAAFPDDDDKETLLGRKMSRLSEDMVEGVNLVDLTRMAKNPVASFTRAYNIIDVSVDFIGGILTGDRLQNGNIPGETILRKNLPIFSSEYNMSKVLQESFDYDNLR